MSQAERVVWTLEQDLLRLVGDAPITPVDGGDAVAHRLVAQLQGRLNADG